MGESAALTLRGAEPTQTLILLDGIRLNSPFRGGFDLGNLVVDQIEQVEVVRGAQSVLYGSDAMGGVVDLKTRRGRGSFETSLTAEAGNEGSVREVLSVGEERPRADYRLTVSRTDTDGRFDRDRFGASAFSGQVGVPIRDTGRLQFISRFQIDRKELAIDILPVSADTVQVVFDQNNELQRRFVFHSIQLQHRVASRLELSWKAAVVNTELNWDNPADSGPASGDYFEKTDTRTLILDLQQNLLLGRSDTLSFGIERQRDQVDSTIVTFGSSFPVDQSRGNTAYYLQNLFKREDRLVVQAGVRRDENESVGPVTNPKISSAYQLKSTGTRLRGSWGTAFRGPTIQELFFPVFGNPDLKPERSWSWEMGLQQKFLGEAVLLDAVFYRIDYHDLIEKSPTGVANIGRARTQGVESDLTIHLHPTLTAKTNYTYLKATDRTTDEELPFRPRHLGNIALLYTPTVHFIAEMTIHMVSSQAITADFILLDGSVLQDRSPGYTGVDLSAAYHLFGGALGLRESRIFVRIKNLFDREHQDVPGFPAPGIQFWTGVTAML